MPDRHDPRLAYARGAGAAGTGLLGRVIGAAVGAVVLVASLLFSVAVFAVILTVGVLVGGYLWWRTRDLRRQLREQMQASTQSGPFERGGPAAEPRAGRGEVLDGDFIREAPADDDGSARRRDPGAGDDGSPAGRQGPRPPGG